MLLVEGLTKRFGPLLALDNIDFSVAPGQIVGFLGPNGAGKTTTMRAIMQLVTVDDGATLWDGKPIDADIRQQFGYMPAERGMYARMKVRDHLLYYAKLSGRSGEEGRRVVDTWLERLGLDQRGGDTVQSLSSGNQQRVQLALALLTDPKLLVLDEPFSGLDPIAADMLNDVLREQVANGAALLLSSHQLDLVAEVCSDVVIVDHGRVALRGDVAELRANSSSRYIDVEFGEPTQWDSGIAARITNDGRKFRLHVDATIDATALIAAAHQHGSVVAFSFAPPDLSEVFLSAVGQNTVDEDQSSLSNAEDAQ